MVSILSKLFIKDRNNLHSPSVRRAYGVLCGALGIVLNIFLSVFKLIASALTGSVSIAADAFNNLSDAGSSLITLIGFKLSGQKPDPSHPFGHGRIEYISGFIVSMIIMLMGFELGKSSVTKLIDGSPQQFSLVSVIILSTAILVKVYMYIYNSSVARKIDSAAMMATATDSLTDCISTGVVLVCTVLSKFLSFPLDGWCGLAVSLFILYSGFNTAKQTIDPLLGTPPEPEFVKRIENIVMSYSEISGIHDLIVHNYGPGRVMISLHAEVPQTVDILHIHDTIDNIEHHLAIELSCDAVIHMDPIATDDETTNLLREKVSSLAKNIDSDLTIHDFRVVIGKTHTNLIFDIVLPFSFFLSDEEVKERMRELISELSPEYRAVINIDKSYT